MSFPPFGNLALISCHELPPVQGMLAHKSTLDAFTAAIAFLIPPSDRTSSSIVKRTTRQPLDDDVGCPNNESAEQQNSTNVLSNGFVLSPTDVEGTAGLSVLWLEIVFLLDPLRVNPMWLINSQTSCHFSQLLNALLKIYAAISFVWQ